LIGVKAEVVKCAPANRISVLVLGKCFAIPSYGIGGLSDGPWRAAVSLIVLRAVVSPPGFLWWRVKIDVADINPKSQRHAERLNSAVEILVVHGVFVMPYTGTWVGHFVTHKPNSVVAWIGFYLAYRPTSPGRDGWLHLHRRADGRKCEIVWASVNGKPPVGDIVIHVALPGMRLTPRVLMRSDVLTFRKIGRSSVERRVQIIDLNPDPVGYAVMVVAVMVIGNVVPRGEKAREGVYPGARS